MIDTKAVRAWADAAEEEWDNEIIPKTLRQCAETIDRQAEALKILDGFKGPPPTKDQWDGICALALALKEVLK